MPSGTSDFPLQISEGVLPKPRFIIVHGEIEDEKEAAVLDIITATVSALVDHRLVEHNRTAGGHDWSGWHLPDPEMLIGLSELAMALSIRFTPCWKRYFEL